MEQYIVLFSLLLSVVACEKESAPVSVVSCETEYPELAPGEIILRVNHYKESCEHWIEENASCLLVQREDKLCSGEWSFL